ncbi:MAG: phosphodiesterase [Aquincola sp.]|nr:phosphodiesterase [Aquincola sp.]
MLIGHLSDIHLFVRKPDSTFIRPDIADALQRIVADIAAFVPAIDIVVLTGDLTDCGAKEDYALLRELLAPLSAKVLAIPGNHDLRANFRRAFNDILPFEEGESAQYEVVHGGTRFLALDTVDEGNVAGRLCPQRLAWVEKKLAEPFAGPTTILMHHPPNVSGIAFFDNIGLVEGAGEFGRMIARHRGSLNIMCGHIHRPTQALWNGAFLAVAGSPAFQTDLDLQVPAVDPTVVDIPYAYFVYNRTGDGNFSVHPRYVALSDRTRSPCAGVGP